MKEKLEYKILLDTILCLAIFLLIVAILLSQ